MVKIMRMLEADHPGTAENRLAHSSSLQPCRAAETPPRLWCSRAAREKQSSRRIVPLASLLVVACAPLDFLLLQGGHMAAAAALSALSMVAAVGAIVEAKRIEGTRNSELVEADRMHAQAFQRASTSIWVEDWTEVGKVVLALRGSGVKPQEYFAAHPDILPRLHRTVRITDVNDMTVSFVGARDKSVLIGWLAEIVPASAHTFEHWVSALIRGDAFYRSESRIRRQDGSMRDCLVTAALPTEIGNFRHLLVSIIDITDYKADQARLAATEREIARASRTLTIGALTAAIAHEVNNPLAAIVTNAGASLRWLHRAKPDLAEAEAAISDVIGEAMRARDIVDRTRRLVTEVPPTLTELNLAEAIHNIIPLVERDLRESGVSLQVGVEPGTPRVMADAVQFQQILTNLLLNAKQAMAETEGLREIKVSAHLQTEGICITVSDTGPGIAPECLNRLFDPFFSMRQGGMGMGLTICKACVEAQGGRIWATSSPGDGATFAFTLPVAASR
jgi:C4-dicarboxylate-specific signal transduction histidine kinase